MKIHIIKGINIENEINQFIKGRKIIDIKYTTPFNLNGNTITGLNYDIYDSVMIIYKEEDKDENNKKKSV